jgi:hypothetical protein
MKANAAMEVCVMVLVAILGPIIALRNNTEAVAAKARLDVLVEAYIVRCEAKSSLRLRNQADSMVLKKQNYYQQVQSTAILDLDATLVATSTAYTQFCLNPVGVKLRGF